MSGIEGSIRKRLGARLKPVFRDSHEGDGPTSSADVMDRLLEGTTLLFDKERIVRKRKGRLDNSGAYTSRQRSSAFTIAFVDTEIGVEDEVSSPKRFTFNAPGYAGILVPLNDVVTTEMRGHLIRQLALSLKIGADAVVFPEFALPPIDVSDLCSEKENYSSLDAVVQNSIDARFESMASGILSEARDISSCELGKTPFIFYGSMHCRGSRYNVGVVSPGSPFENGYTLVSERGNPITDKVGVVSQELERSGPLVHKKRFPARRAGEKASVPSDLGFRLYPSKIGLIAVLICSDAIDLNQVLYIVRHNQDADFSRNFERIGLVVVPAYTRSEFLHTACRDLSDLAKTTVFVGNATGQLPTANRLHTTKLPAPKLFQSGKDEDQLLKTGRLRIILDSGVRFYRFNAALPPQ